MHVSYRWGNRRKAIFLLHAIAGSILGYLLFRMSGFGLSLLAAHIHWQRMDWHQERSLDLGGRLEHYWQTDSAVALKYQNESWQWVYADEVSEQDYALIRRTAKLTLNRQPVGLSISR